MIWILVENYVVGYDIIGAYTSEEIAKEVMVDYWAEVSDYILDNGISVEGYTITSIEVCDSADISDNETSTFYSIEDIENDS